MKNTFTILFLTIFSFVSFGQMEILKKNQLADSFIKTNNLIESYRILKEIEPKCDTKDTNYHQILWNYVSVATELEKQSRLSENFDKSIEYGLEALTIIDKAKPFFNPKFAAREYFMIKNVIVSYFGLGQLENAKKYKDKLYDAYQTNKLPQGLDQYFNFTFFKWQNNNVWGYEWFEEIPENRMSKSFSKIVYYIYSTKPDGTDNEQLYRLHVLMFHKMDTSIKFDYVLTKRLETAKNEVEGTLISYTYQKEIDYQKLQVDIKEVLNGNYEPGIKTNIKKK